MSAMMTPMKTARLVPARPGAPAEFVGLCKALYGELIDPDAIWDEVAKLAPAPSQEPKNNLKRNAAFAGTAAGTAIGVKELVHGVKGLRATGGSKLRPALSLAGAGAMLGADVLAADELRPNKNKGTLVPAGQVSKLSMPRLTALPKVVDGLKRIWTSGATAASTGGAKAGFSAAKDAASHEAGQGYRASLGIAAPKAPTEHLEAAGQNRWNNAGQMLGQGLSTPAGKLIAATNVATVGGYGVHAANKRRNQAQTQVDPMATYAKAEGNDVTFVGTFSKLDEDQRLAFGWASVTKINGTPVVDRQGDYIAIEDIEKAAYDYVHKSRVGGDMHKRTDDDRAHHVSDMVESIVFTDDKVRKMGLPEDFPRGWWVGFKIHDDSTWDLVKKGERTGFSIHGRGIRKDHDLDELMGYTA